jgi:glycosyltransferase involved in cell wall biosynthesis
LEQKLSGTNEKGVETISMISVLNLTNRPGGIDILWANMLRQTIEDWQLVIVDGKWREREEDVKKYINDTRLKYVRQSDKREGAYTNLAHADNEGFKACDGDLIVLLQDYIWIPPDALEKYLWHYQTNSKALVTGVGHQYGSPSKEDVVEPSGKITVFKEPYTKRPENIIWQDPRIFPRPSLDTADPVEWEMNWASIPKNVIYDLGGMDEEYDFKGFAWDNTCIATRAKLLGYPILIDTTNECMGFNHDGWWPNPLKVEKVSPGNYFHEQTRKMVNGEISPRLDYLK